MRLKGFIVWGAVAMTTGLAFDARSAATGNVTNLIDRLDPLTARVIGNYVRLTDIPRPSYGETRVSDAIVAWARERGFTPTQDHLNSVWFDVPATAGMEVLPRTILQGHLDMVAVGFKDPTAESVVIDCETDGTLHSLDYTTSIGADDGIGVAMAMTVAEGGVPHGPLRILFTTDEERTQSGAAAIDPLVLTAADFLINIDYDYDGEVTISSAAYDSLVITGAVATAAATCTDAFRIEIAGFRGGHSGFEIGNGHINAIVGLGQLLTNVAAHGISFELAEVKGGDAVNAIPSHAASVVRIPSASRSALEELLADAQQAYRDYGETEATVSLTPTNGFVTVFSATATTNLLECLSSIHDGVWNMSAEVAGLVETSVNLGVIDATTNGVTVLCAARGSVESTLTAEEEAIRQTVEECGYEVEMNRACAPWPANLDNPLIGVMTNAWREITGGEMKVVSIHAGLECGWFATAAPELDIVSVGPTIVNPHARNEAVGVNSISNGIRLIARALATLPVEAQPEAPFPATHVGVCSWSWATNMTTILGQMDMMGVKCMQLSLVPWVKPLNGIEYDASLRETFGKGETGDVFAAISNRIAKGEISVLSTMISFPFDRWGSYQAISNSNGIVCNIATNDAVGEAVSADDPLGLAAWTVNSNLVEQAAAMTRQLGVEYITTEVGYLDKVMMDHGTNANQDCNIGMERLYQTHRLCAKYGVKLLFESGQHSGEETLALVNRYTNRYANASFENAYGLTVNDIGINYDTANHLIYENDSSTNAFTAMQSRIVQVHVKDSYIALADRAAKGNFAVDVKWGTADASKTYDTLAYLKAAGFRGNLLVEHEWGNDRVGDINAALKAILLANNEDPGDPWIAPDVMIGATAGERCEAALRAQGFSSPVAGCLADEWLYADFRGWAENKGLMPDGLVGRDGVILAAAYDASEVPAADEVTVRVDDLVIDPSDDGIMTLTVRAESEAFNPANINSRLLKASLGLKGTDDLATGEFSAETFDLAFGEIEDGGLPVMVVPRSTTDIPLDRFFLKVTAE